MQLHKAVEAGSPYIGEVRRLLKAKAPVNYAFADEWSPLHIAAEAGLEDVCGALLGAGADTTVRDGEGLRPFERAHTATLRSRLGGPSLELHSAAQRGDVEEVRARLQAGEEVDGCDVLGRTAVHVAAAASQLDTLDLLLKAGSQQHGDRRGITPLHRAAEEGHLEAAQMLLMAKASPNIQGADGRTALHAATTAEQREVVELLMTNKASANLRDEDGSTPLLLAVDGTISNDDKVNAVIKPLLQGRAEVGVTGGGLGPFKTALHAATIAKMPKVVKLLLDSGINVDAVDATGTSAAHLAARMGNMEVFRALLEAKADVTITDQHGKTVYSYAVANNRQAIIELLR